MIESEKTKGVRQNHVLALSEVFTAIISGHVRVAEDSSLAVCEVVNALAISAALLYTTADCDDKLCELYNTLFKANADLFKQQIEREKADTPKGRLQ